MEGKPAEMAYSLCPILEPEAFQMVLTKMFLEGLEERPPFPPILRSISTIPAAIVAGTGPANGITLACDSSCNW